MGKIFDTLLGKSTVSSEEDYMDLDLQEYESG